MKADPVEGAGKSKPSYQAMDIREKKDMVGRSRSPVPSTVGNLMSLTPLSNNKLVQAKKVARRSNRKEALRRELITGWQKAKKPAKVEREMVRLHGNVQFLSFHSNYLEFYDRDHKPV